MKLSSVLGTLFATRRTPACERAANSMPDASPLPRLATWLRERMADFLDMLHLWLHPTPVPPLRSGARAIDTRRQTLLPPAAPPKDHQLSAGAKTWLNELPCRIRPIAMCVHHPRLVNRIARCWRDPVRAERLLDSLALDQRGSRRGFSKEVAVELMRLRAFGKAQVQGQIDAEPTAATAPARSTAADGDRRAAPTAGAAVRQATKTARRAAVTA